MILFGFLRLKSISPVEEIPEIRLLKAAALCSSCSRFSVLGVATERAYHEGHLP